VKESPQTSPSPHVPQSQMPIVPHLSGAQNSAQVMQTVPQEAGWQND
jgi:hypothetical protein